MKLSMKFASKILKSDNSSIPSMVGTLWLFFFSFAFSLFFLGGWMVASLICLNVTARCSYESCACLVCLNVTA